MAIPSIFSKNNAGWKKCFTACTLYLVVTFTGIARHELWLDEAHHFLLALWSNSIPDLLFNARYDGHPVFWNTLLFVITRFTANPFYMQVLNVIISCLAVFIFLRKAPFSFLFKVLFVAGYFMVYEYGIISRNYALSCLFLFTVLSIYPNRNRHKLAYALCLAVFANTHLFSTIITLVLLLQMLWEDFYSTDAGKQNIYIFSVIAMLGIALAIWQAVPPADGFLYKYAPPWDDESGKIFSMPFRAIFYLPDIADYFCWNTNFFTVHYWNFCEWLFPVPAILALIILWGKPKSLFFFFTCGIGIMALAFFSLSYAIRHCGFIYMIFIAALWMSYYESQKAWGEKNEWLNQFIKAGVHVFIWAILLLHIVSSCVMYAKDFTQPFSESKEVSAYLTQQSLNNKFIMVGNENIIPPVSAYLHRKLYNTGGGREAAFRYWNDTNYNVSDSILIVKVNEQLCQRDSIIVLLDHELPDRYKPANMRLLKKFDKAFLKSENYFVYLAQ